MIERRDVPWLAGALALVALVYAPAWASRTAFSDDHPLLVSAVAGDGSVSEHVVSGGRPIYAVLLDVSFRAAGSIDGLQPLRLLGTMGVLAVAAVAFLAVRRTGVSRWAAAGLAAAIALLPPFQTFAGWATAWPFGWAAAAAGAGSLLLLHALGRERPGWALPAAAVATITGAFLVYQPAAMFVWVPLAAHLALRLPAAPEVKRVVVAHGAAVVVAVGAGFVLARGVMAVAGVDPISRAALVGPGDVPSKLSWFASRPIVLGLRPFVIASPDGIEAALWALPVLAAAGAGLLVLVRRRQALVPLVTLVALVPLTALPNLVTAENQIEFRILAGLAPTMLLLLAAGARGLLEVTPRRDLVGRAATAAVVVVAAGLAAVNTTSLFVDRGSETVEWFEAALADFDPAAHDRIAVLVPLEGWGAFDDVGIWSTTSDATHAWVPAPLTQLVLDERGIEWPADRVEVVREADDVPDGAFLVDATDLRDRVAAR